MKWRSSQLSVRVNRGAGIFSDKSLQIGKVKLKLTKTRKGQERGIIINSGALRYEGTNKVYRLELQNRFRELKDRTDLNFEDFNQVYI